MPARAERVYLFPAEEGQAAGVLKFPQWWDRSEFLKKYRERRIDTNNPIYVDYAFLLTLGEALAWDKKCRARLSDDAKKGLESEMHQLEAALKKSKWVIVESYEWESGME